MEATYQMQQLAVGLLILLCFLFLVKVWLDVQRNRTVAAIDRWIRWEKLTPTQRLEWDNIVNKKVKY